MIKAQRLFKRLSELGKSGNKGDNYRAVYNAVREELGSYLIKLARQGKLYSEYSTVKGFLHNVNLEEQNRLDNTIVNIDGEYFVREGNEWRNEL